MGAIVRRLIELPCGDDTIVATLDVASGPVGLLIVSGGNELRCGAHRGMAMLARALAGSDVPVLRYDRRGIGDSTGDNRGFDESADDIAAAAVALRREADVRRVVALGNCDAASALALFHARAGIDALILSNPWTGGGDDPLPAAAAIRARYAERLRNPREWLRLLRGGVNLRKLASGLAKVARSTPPTGGLIDRMGGALRASGVPTTILLAARDNTAIAFADAWARCDARSDVPLTMRNSASHSYAAPGDAAWLQAEVLKVLREVAGPVG